MKKPESRKAPDADDTVAGIMRKKFPALKKTDKLSTMLALAVSTPEMVYPVLDESGKVIGQVNQHDMLNLAVPAKGLKYKILGPQGIRGILQNSAETVSDMMKSYNVEVRPDMMIRDAARLMLKTGARAFRVVDEKGRQVGYVSELDILGYMQRKLEKEGK